MPVHLYISNLSVLLLCRKSYANLSDSVTDNVMCIARSQCVSVDTCRFQFVLCTWTAACQRLLLLTLEILRL